MSHVRYACKTRFEDFHLRDEQTYMEFETHTCSISLLTFYLNCRLAAEQREFVVVKIISFLHDQYYNNQFIISMSMFYP